MRCARLFVGTSLSLSLLAACGQRDNRQDHSEADAEHAGNHADAARTFTAALAPTEGNSTSGVVTFTPSGEGVIVVAHVTGLTPGKHGFHIHEKGDCSAPDGTSAGGHYNPDVSPHGAPSNPPQSRHAGDLGNLEADASGMAHFETTDHVIAMDGPESILGKAVIVHAGADDLTSQPTGAAGARLACGVIERPRQ